MEFGFLATDTKKIFLKKTQVKLTHCNILSFVFATAFLTHVNVDFV